MNDTDKKIFQLPCAQVKEYKCKLPITTKTLTALADTPKAFSMLPLLSSGVAEHKLDMQRISLTCGFHLVN